MIIIKRESGASDQEEDQDNIQETNGVTNEVANGVTNEVNPVKVSLTSTQKDMINSDNPQASNQKYRKKKK